MIQRDSGSHRSRVAIIGAGFGGLSAAKVLQHAPFDVIVIDHHNDHLFQPLLYQVATAALSPAGIASPTRSILRDQKNATVVLGRVSHIDLEQKQVVTEEIRIKFDYLIVATGAQQSSFGHDEWTLYASGLKSIDDATYVRRHLLNFVVIGGRATGVEIACAIAELASEHRQGISARSTRDPPASFWLKPRRGCCPLSTSGCRRRHGIRSNVSGSRYGSAPRQGVSLGDQRIEARTVIWAAAVKASPAGHWLDARTDRAGRVEVAADLSVPGHPDIFAIGDTALVLDENGKPLLGLAAVAKQQGQYVADVLVGRARGNSISPFRYRAFGAMGTIGRKHAIAQIGGLTLSGFPAWLLWSMVHIYFLFGFRDRLFVAASWLWNYLTFQRGIRLITGISGSRIETMNRDHEMPPLPPRLAGLGRGP